MESLQDTCSPSFVAIGFTYCEYIIACTFDREKWKKKTSNQFFESAEWNKKLKRDSSGEKLMEN